MLLQHLEDAREVFRSLKGSLVGVGMTAYSRIIPSYFSKNYRIVALRKTGDLEVLRKRAEIFCLEERIGGAVKERDFQSARLLSHPLTRQYLRGLPDPKYLFLYQSYPELEDLARQEKWTLVANPSGLRMETGARTFFHPLIGKLGLNEIPGFFVPIQELWAHGYPHWAENIGVKLVVQLPEIRQGGGRGTFFIFSEPQFQSLRDRLKEKTWRGSRLETAVLRKYVEGTPASVALCITREGVLSSRVQVQLLDLPFCRIPEKGVFCGHSWGSASWHAPAREKVLAQTLPIGEYMRRRGFRGILGIDLVIESGEGKVYPLEMNPRLTGAFPMLSQLHMEKGLVPMEAFHILQFLDLPYEANHHALNEKYAEPVKGSHMLLFLMGRGAALKSPNMKAGLYQMDETGEGACFVRPAMEYDDLRDERQFIIVDGPPRGELGSEDPLYRLCRLLFPYPLEGEEGALLKRALGAAEWTYRQILEG